MPDLAAALLTYGPLGIYAIVASLVIRHQNKRIDSLTDRLAEKDKLIYERAEASDERNRTVQTKSADALAEIADALRDHTHTTAQSLDRNTDQLNRLTEVSGRMRDDLIQRPRSSASTAAFQQIVDEREPVERERTNPGRRRP